MNETATLKIVQNGPVCTLILNRAEQFNPVDVQSATDLTAALEAAERDPETRVVVLTGEGKALSAGGNVRLMKKELDQGGSLAALFGDIVGALNRAIITIRRLKMPVVCAMSGVAAGAGVGLVLASDLVVAGAGLRFEPAYLRLGLNPDGGLTCFAPRMMGHKRASRFYLLNDGITSETALEWGLVNRVVPREEVLAVAGAMATELAKGPAEALAHTKRLINQAMFPDLEGILESERESIMLLSEQPDFREGVMAFFEKREPVFEK